MTTLYLYLYLYLCVVSISVAVYLPPLCEALVLMLI